VNAASSHLIVSRDSCEPGIEKKVGGRRNGRARRGQGDRPSAVFPHAGRPWQCLKKENGAGERRGSPSPASRGKKLEGGEGGVKVEVAGEGKEAHYRWGVV